MMKEMALAFTIGGTLSNSFGGSIKGATKKMAELQGQAKQLQTSLKMAEQAQKLLTKSFEAGGMGSEKYKANLKNIQNQIKGYQKSLGDNALLQAKAANDNLNSGSGSLSFAEHIPKAVAAATAMGYTLKSCTDEAMKFESAMADVKKVVDFDTPQQFKEMNRDIVALSKTIPMTAEDIAKMVAAGGQAGIAKEELLGFAESAAKMGVAFDITAEQAGDMMAKWRTAFKMNQADVVSLADKINYLGNTTAASAPLISDVVTRIGPLGEVGGVASGEIAALGASIVGAGVNSEIAATGIKNLILGMTAGEGATNSQAAAFQALGMDAGEMAVRMQTDAKGAILDVMKALKSLSKERQATVLSDLFGKESIGAIAPLLSNLEALEDNFNKVGDSTKYAGSMDGEFAARCETTENSIQLMKNSLSAMAINIGSMLLPAIKDVVEALAVAVNWAADFATQHETLTKVLVYAASAVIGFVAAVNVLKSPIMLVIKHIGTIRTVVSVLFSVVQNGITVLMPMIKGLFLLISSHPIIAIITAIIGALIYLWNTNEWFRNGVTAAWEAICSTAWEAFGGAVTAVSDAMSDIWNTVNGTIDWIRDKWEGLKNLLSAPIETAVSVMSKSADITANAAGGIYGKGAFLTTFAENSPEAAIPIDGSKRAESLWRQTGAMMGLTGNSMNVSLSIPVTVNGNADQGTINRIQQGIDDVVERALARIQHQRGRVSYA